MRTINNKQKALIKVAQRELGLSDDEYRAALASVGVTSSVDLTQAKFSQLMDHFKSCGFTPKTKSGKKSGQTWRNRKQPQSKEAMLGKIGAILLDLDLPWSYADNTALRMFQIPRVLWLSPEQLHKLIGALAIHQERKKREAQAHV